MDQFVSPHYHLTLPGRWVDNAVLARALRRAGEPHDERIESIDFTFSSGCRLLVDSGTQLLSLINQLAHSGREVVLNFDEGYEGVMGYLHRLAFFDLLHPAVRTVPTRPATSAFAAWSGSNPNLVEFKRICPQIRDSRTPSLLADALEAACQSRTDRKRLGHAAYTVLGELIDNIYEHSDTPIDGYAALQVYRGGNNVLVAVSDSGAGLLNTLRPTLTDATLANLPDTNLVVHMLNDGLSRLESESPERGAGLCRCAGQALKFQAELKLRLTTSSLHIVPDKQTAQNYDATAHCREELPFLYGTHFAFRFQLSST